MQSYLFYFRCTRCDLYNLEITSLCKGTNSAEDTKKEYPKLIGRSFPIKNLNAIGLRQVKFLLKLKLIESYKTSVKTELIE